MKGRLQSAAKLLIIYNFYIYINYLIKLYMDQEQAHSPVMHPQGDDLQEQPIRASSHNSSQSKQNQENKVPRRPGRPPLRIKKRIKRIMNGIELQNQNDEDFQAERPKLKQRNTSNRQEKQNSLQGFIKIIDYLKKIECDEHSLHNKMNPYNLLTPTCFWYMVSAEYFSYDFFTNKNPQQTALEIIKKAQRTQISLPLRFIKPQRLEVELQFQTPELKSLAIPISEKLTSLSNSISIPTSNTSQFVQKSGFLTSISEDNQFRSSTRAIVFNWIKKKMSSNQKWNFALRPKLEGSSKIPPKQFTCRIYQCEQQKKHEQLEVAPEINYRPRKIQKSESEIKKPKPVKKPIIGKKKSKKPQQDEIYDESQSQKIKKQDSPADEKIIEQQQQQQEKNEIKMEEENAQIKNQKQNQDQRQEKIQEQKLHQINEKIEEGVQLQEQNMDDSDKQENKNRSYETINIMKTYTEDDILLDSILHMPIDNIISILKSSIETPRLPYLIRPFMPAPKNDPLELVYQIHQDEQVFLNYMKQRQERMYQQKTSHSEVLIEQKERQCQVQDAKCQVCTDGDYTEDNLIVFCSMCNISLHQRCVGLAKVPADNWVCEVCASFGPAGINVPCPLCNVKGGALKRTSIHINTPLFKDTNPQYHEFAKKCPNYKHKQQYVNHSKGPGAKSQQQPYYDYFSKASYPNDEPVCHYVWVHYVCAIWIPQCYFEQKNGLINIKGIENIDKKRFKQRCLACKQVRAGACVKCDNENCTKYYHPECARKKKIYMEQLNLDKLKYLVFCEAHEPLKVKRKIQVKKKKQRDQIVKFCRGIEKYVQTYKIANLPFKLLKIGNTGSNQANKVDGRKDKTQQAEQKIMIKIEKNTDQDFIKSVIQGLIKQNQIIVNVTCIGNDRYKVDEIIKPSKRDMRKSLTRQDQFWKNYKSNETPEANLRRFNNIMRQNNYLKQKIENFINFGSNPEENVGKQDKKASKRGLGRRKKDRIQTVIQEQGAIFCVCRRPYNGQSDMFQCQVCNEWYHHQCIGFVGSEDDAQKLVFHCMKCLKFESPEARKQLLEKCSDLFSPDSLYLNYRPPTPTLRSQDEDAKPSNNQNQEFEKDIHQHLPRSEKSQKIKLKARGTSQPIQYDILPQKINLDMPFIIFDSNSFNAKISSDHGAQRIEEQTIKIQKHNQMKEDLLQNEISSEQKIGQEKNVVQKSNVQQQNVRLDISHQLSIQSRAYSIQSSQFPTPEFRPQLISFGGETDGIQKLESEIPLKLESAEKQKQNDEKQQNDNSNKVGDLFHFNRQEIQKLKSAIDQQQQNNGQSQMEIEIKKAPQDSEN